MQSVLKGDLYPDVKSSDRTLDRVSLIKFVLLLRLNTVRLLYDALLRFVSAVRLGCTWAWKSLHCSVGWDSVSLHNVKRLAGLLKLSRLIIMSL
jgi:hypothetical protein